ncbi:MAG: peptidoglycan DD-metalloendopeptidase family protein [Pseudomonadota bacterium]
MTIKVVLNALNLLFLSGFLLVFLGLAENTGIGSFAQELETQQQSSRKELEELREEISISEKRRTELKVQIEQLDKDRTSINRSLIDASKKFRGLEKRVDTSEKRMLTLRSDQQEVQASLKLKEGLLAEILGALQRMGRKPPPALLIKPQDALSSVRSAILLGSVVPEVMSETQILISELNRLSKIETEISSERESLTIGLTELAQEEERLNLLLEEKQKLAGIAMSGLAQESVKAAQLAARATSLNQLITDLETQIESAKTAAEEARVAEEQRIIRDQNREVAARKFEESDFFSDPGRKAPAVAFSSAEGLLPLPVSGDIVRAFGDKDLVGEEHRGISLSARRNARVISPADGWIVYAGPFRSYGQLLIINAGQGYHVVLAGMAAINVQPGQFVIVGEPLGQMGDQQVASTSLVEVSTQTPILYVEFRNNGKSIDPAPWWAQTNLESTSNGT